MLISVFVLYFLMYGNISFFGKVRGFAQPNLIETVGAFFLLQIFWGATIPVSTVLWSLSAEWFVNLLAVFTRKKIKVYLMLSLGFLLEILGLYINQKFQLGWQIFNYLIAIGRALVGFYLGLILRQSLKVKKRSFSLKRIIFVLFVFSINFYLLQKSIIFVIFSAPICYFIVREVVFIDEKRFPKLVLRFCRYLGRISYGVYLWHTIVGTLAFSSLILKFVPFTIENYNYLLISKKLNCFDYQHRFNLNNREPIIMVCCGNTACRDCVITKMIKNKENAVRGITKKRRV
jgi:peptidoglycan/LPS O-acetylase OafA/YrhL